MREHTVVLFGGLGNQLFQYAFGRQLTIASGRGAQFVRAGNVSVEDLRTLTGAGVHDSVRGLTPLGRLAPLHALVTRAGGRSVQVDLGMAPLVTPEAMQRPAVWCGYWQHPSYVSDEAGVPAQVAASLGVGSRRQPNGRPQVALHVRRGDYVGQVPALSPAYFARAFVAVCEGLAVDPGHAEAVLVSDDPAWARSHLRLPTSHVSATPGTPLHDLATLAGAAGIVMSQSTFSWWAARIATEAVVAVPRPWRLRRDQTTDDGGGLRLADWTAVDATYA